MNRYGVLSVYFVVVCLMLAGSTAHAQTISFEAAINGAQANAGAGSGSSATGFGTMTYNTNSNLFAWDISWSGLEGTFTAAHFHGPATPSQSAGVQLGILLTGPAASIGSATITSGQEAALMADLWYVNIHSTTDPGGEIRGQVQMVPEPASALLVLLGAGSVFFMRRSFRERRS